MNKEIPKIFGNGLSAQLGYLNKAVGLASSASNLLAKRRLELVEGLYKELIQLITDPEFKEILDSKTQTAQSLLLELSKGLISDKGETLKESNFCCSTYALKCSGDKKALEDLIVKVRENSEPFGGFASVKGSVNGA